MIIQNNLGRFYVSSLWNFLSVIFDSRCSILHLSKSLPISQPPMLLIQRIFNSKLLKKILVPDYAKVIFLSIEL